MMMTMTIAKEELINAAEVLRLYCKEHEGKGCMLGKSGCLLSDECNNYFTPWHGIGHSMKNIIHDARYSDEADM